MLAGVAIVFAAGDIIGTRTQGIQDAEVQSASRVFELRTYTTPEGKLPDLQARFRDHTMNLFEKHGMTNIGYCTPQDEPNSANTLVYIIADKSREAAAASWEAFGVDEEWMRVARASQANGLIVRGVVSVFLDPTDFSPIK